jgi:hypothetical protein
MYVSFFFYEYFFIDVLVFNVQYKLVVSKFVRMDDEFQWFVLVFYHMVICYCNVDHINHLDHQNQNHHQVPINLNKRLHYQYKV